MAKTTEKIIETDVLVVGGGIAGCPAAYKAAEKGLKVTLVEKSKTERSGSAGQGIDHHSGTFPRGMTPADFNEQIKGVTRYTGERGFDPNIRYILHAARDWSIAELEKMGVPMRWDDGKFMVIDVAFHGGWPVLHVHWQNVKPIMAKAVKKMGVNVLDRTMVVDLLTNKGRVVGATAINSRTGEFIIIKAKTVILATAKCARIFDSETPLPWKYKFNFHWCPASVSGDGWAMAYRAGAELASLEQSGKGSRIRDDKALSWGNFRGWGVEGKSTNWKGEEGRSGTPSGGPPSGAQRPGAPGAAPEARPAPPKTEGGVPPAPPDPNREAANSPKYNTLAHIPDDFKKRTEVAYVDERMVSMVISQERGFDFRSHYFELQEDNRPMQLHQPCGVFVGSDFQTRVKGLYAIGDTVYGVHNVALAATNGFIVGDRMPEIIKNTPEPVLDMAQVESQRQVAMASTQVKDGTNPVELEASIRYACTRYVGGQKAEGKLREGIRRLGSLKREFLPKLQGDNPHFQMRSLEVRNLMDIAELHMLASLERKESRFDHTRLDYPKQDPALDNMVIVQRLENGKPVTEFRKLPELDMNQKPDPAWC